MEAHHVNTKLHKFNHRVSFTKRIEIENNKDDEPSSLWACGPESDGSYMSAVHPGSQSLLWKHNNTTRVTPMCIPDTPCLLNASSNFTGGKQSWKFRWKTDWDLNVKQVPQLCHPDFTRHPRVISIQFSTFHQFKMVLHYLLTLLFIYSFQK